MTRAGDIAGAALLFFAVVFLLTISADPEAVLELAAGWLRRMA